MGKLFRLTWEDLAKGLIVSVLATILKAVEEAIRAGSFDWRTIAGSGLVAGLAYLGKQLLTDNQGQVLGKIDLK